MILIKVLVKEVGLLFFVKDKSSKLLPLKIVYLEWLIIIILPLLISGTMLRLSTSRSINNAGLFLLSMNFQLFMDVEMEKSASLIVGSLKKGYGRTLSTIRVTGSMMCVELEILS